MPHPRRRATNHDVHAIESQRRIDWTTTIARSSSDAGATAVTRRRKRRYAGLAGWAGCSAPSGADGTALTTRPVEVERAVGPEDDRSGESRPEIEEEARESEEEKETRAPLQSSPRSVSGSPPKAPDDISSITSPGRALSRRIPGISARLSGAKAGFPFVVNRERSADRSIRSSGFNRFA